MLGNESIPEIRAEIDDLRDEIFRLRSKRWDDKDSKRMKTKEWESQHKRKAEYSNEAELERQRAERQAEEDGKGKK